MALLEKLKASVFQNPEPESGVIVRLELGQEDQFEKLKKLLGDVGKPLSGRVLYSPLPNTVEILLHG